MLKLIKKGEKYWLFEYSEIGLFSPSKFTINLLNNVITIVYENGLKSKNYNVIDCEIYDLGATSPFTTSSGNAFMQKLEELNCPCFQKNENIFNISGGAWGDITGTLSDQTDLQSALDLKLDKVSTAGVERAYIINADGSQGTKATSEFGGVTSVTGDSVDNTNPLNPIINAIPLSGTTVGNPVTGDIEISGESSLRTDTYTGVFISSNDDLVRLLRGETQIILDNEPYITVDAPYSSQGLHGTQDFTGNITDLDYTQKKYVDTKVPKVSTAGVERAYIINADGSQGTKATSEFGDVLEFANLASFPTTGETGKIYVALDTNFTYRWSGSAYVPIGGGEIYIENIYVTGGYTVDFNIDTHRLTLTGNTTFSEINLPPVGFSKTITLHITGNFGVVFPASWTQYISGTYKGTAPLNTIVVEAFGSFRKVQISQPD